MKSIQIQLTTKCNERCFMCSKYTWDRRQIPIDVLISKLQKYKGATVTFSGGDPLAYQSPCLEELAKYLIDNNVVYQIFTNMNYNLTDVMKAFLDGAKFIQVSLDGSNECIYENVRRCRDNGFDTVFKNVLAYKDKVKINCTVSNRNYFDVYNIYKLCKSNGLIVRFFPVHTDEEAMLKPYMLKTIQYLFKDFSELPTEIEVLLSASLRKDFEGKCFVKSEHRIIDENGNEYPCCRAINDNGEDWGSRNCISNLKDSIDNPNVLYDFCKNCDRYRKFNIDWDLYKDKEELFL